MTRWSLAVAVIGIMATALGVVSLLIRPAAPPECPVEPSVAPVVPSVVVPVVSSQPIAPVAVVDPDPAAVDTSGIATGVCDFGLLPRNMVEQVSAATAAELVAQLRRWVAAREPWNDRPSVLYRRGVLFVQSEEDRGDDGPYPRSAAPEAERVCGTAATWLRADLRDQLASIASPDVGLSCRGNVCCYSGMEYAPNGLVVFHHDPDTGWSLAAWIETYEAALGADFAAANVDHAASSLRRLARTRCPGEPAGSF